MITFKWTILEVFAKDEVITGAKYHLVGTDDDISVETEGNWYFDCPTAKVPYLEVTEEMIANWIEKDAIKDGQNHIKINVEKQIEALKSFQPVAPPWMPQVFTPGQ
ncbi:hypothetical protein UFOVP192_33 [uncultured Caudovirales phage]|uniref:DUF7936 domain-containing protein n=1 Tax=uncultured Caudovirales phage TaxID=2100421 RepID=A0A6J7WMI1_9CAUD|nr:hypothetical protein UFOVP192_33 [uncultured Caudovirales phage]